MKYLIFFLLPFITSFSFAQEAHVTYSRFSNINLSYGASFHKEGNQKFHGKNFTLSLQKTINPTLFIDSKLSQSSVIYSRNIPYIKRDPDTLIETIESTGKIQTFDFGMGIKHAFRADLLLSLLFLDGSSNYELEYSAKLHLIHHKQFFSEYIDPFYDSKTGMGATIKQRVSMETKEQEKMPHGSFMDISYSHFLFDDGPRKSASFDIYFFNPKVKIFASYGITANYPIKGVHIKLSLGRTL